MKGQIYQLLAIRQVSTADVMYMMTIVNNAAFEI